MKEFYSGDASELFVSYVTEDGVERITSDEYQRRLDEECDR